jgi:serine protease Do
MGWVSQKGRAVGLLPYEDFIQTDAAINPGNSGGPLVNAEGHMVGLNAVIQTAGPSGSIGIGFAVPANRAFDIARTLIAGEPITRPWLGILPQEMTIQAARHFLNQDGGVYVGEVFRDTPAYKGGLYRGDIILKVGDTPVTSILELQREVFRREIGKPIPLTILRSNSTREIEMVSERMPDAKLFQ